MPDLSNKLPGAILEPPILDNPRTLPTEIEIVRGITLHTTDANTGTSHVVNSQHPDIETRRREYAICQQRGHVAGFSFSVGGYAPTVATCKHCGTQFWTETVERESGAPDDDV